HLVLANASHALFRCSNYPADIPPQERHERGHALTVAFQAKAARKDSRYMSLLSLAQKSPKLRVWSPVGPFSVAGRPRTGGGQQLTFPVGDFCIWQRALSRCQLGRVSRGHKTIPRDQSASLLVFPPGARQTLLHAS